MCLGEYIHLWRNLDESIEHDDRDALVQKLMELWGQLEEDVKDLLRYHKMEPEE